MDCPHQVFQAGRRIVPPSPWPSHPRTAATTHLDAFPATQRASGTSLHPFQSRHRLLLLPNLLPQRTRGPASRSPTYLLALITLLQPLCPPNRLSRLRLPERPPALLLSFILRRTRRSTLRLFDLSVHQASSSSSLPSLRHRPLRQSSCSRNRTRGLANLSRTFLPGRPNLSGPINRKRTPARPSSPRRPSTAPPNRQSEQRSRFLPLRD